MVCSILFRILSSFIWNKVVAWVCVPFNVLFTNTACQWNLKNDECYVLWDTFSLWGTHTINVCLIMRHILWYVICINSYMNLQNQSAFIKEEKHRNHVNIWCWFKSRVSQRINNIPWRMWLLSSYGIIDALVLIASHLSFCGITHNSWFSFTNMQCPM